MQAEHSVKSFTKWEQGRANDGKMHLLASTMLSSIRYSPLEREVGKSQSLIW